MARDDPDPEIPLGGGNMNSVVRVGDSVRRRLGPWSPGIHALLRHLRESGFIAAPKVVGIDPKGREIMRYIEGEICSDADPRLLWTDGTLVAAGRMLRSFHDAQRGFDVRMNTQWNSIGRELQGIPEVICHNDFAPYNCICRGGELVAMIDFDLAAPGSRVWDLAWSAINWIPLFDPQDNPRQRRDPPESLRRLRLLADAYGLADLGALSRAIRRRIEHLLAVSDERRVAGDPWAVRTESHIPFWRRVRDFIEANAESWH